MKTLAKKRRRKDIGTVMLSDDVRQKLCSEERNALEKILSEMKISSIDPCDFRDQLSYLVSRADSSYFSQAVVLVRRVAEDKGVNFATPYIRQLAMLIDPANCPAKEACGFIQKCLNLADGREVYTAARYEAQVRGQTEIRSNGVPLPYNTRGIRTIADQRLSKGTARIRGRISRKGIRD